MAISTPKPQYCPECNRPYLTRFPKRLEDTVNLGSLYRCRAVDHIYLHEIQHSP